MNFSYQKKQTNRDILNKRLKKRGRKQDSVSSVEKDGVYQTSNVLQVIDKNSQNAVNSAAKELQCKIIVRFTGLNMA